MPDLSQVSVDLKTVTLWTWAAGCVVAALVFARARNPGSLRFHRGGIVAAALVLAAAWLLPQGLGRVQPGARGIVLRFGAPTGTLENEGLYYVVPLAEKVVQMNVQVNTITLDRAQGVSRDLEPVYADLAVTFHVEPDRAIDVYRSLRFDYSQRIVSPAVQDALKATIATYRAGEIVPRRRDVARDLQRELTPRLQRFGLRLDAIATTRLNFAYRYAQAAQAKVVAVQRTLEAEQDLQRIRFESQQSVIRAESEVRALRLQRNIPVPELVRLRELELQRRAIDKWDGHLPQTTTTLPFLAPTLGGKAD